MDGLIRDPELAPELFKLVNDKLSETRKALELSRKASSPQKGCHPYLRLCARKPKPCELSFRGCRLATSPRR